MKRALIIGIYGQIGFYLSNILVQNGYGVKGTIATDWFRDQDDETTGYDGLLFHPSVEMIKLRYRDHDSWDKLIRAFYPDEIYILTPVNIATGHVDRSPAINLDLYEPFILHVLDLAKSLMETYRPHIFHACQTNLFGFPGTIPQSELTPLVTDDPEIKPILRSFLHCRAYRDAYGINATNGILADSLSVYQNAVSFERYISQSLAEVVLGQRETIPVGDLTVKRDRVHALDCAEGIHRAAQQKRADDYLFASGISSGREVLLFHAARPLGLTLRFVTQGNQRLGFLNDLDENKFIEQVGEVYLAAIKGRIVCKDDLKSLKKADKKKAVISSKPSGRGRAEAPFLLGDYSKAKRELNWKPQYHFVEVIKQMVLEDLKRLRSRSADELIKKQILSA